MNVRSQFNRLSISAAVGVMVLVVGACAIKLRDEESTSSASLVSKNADPRAAELARCRTVTPEQKDALEECRRIWAEQRRQFLKPRKNFTPTVRPNDSAPNIRFPSPGLRKDESRLPQGWPSIPRSEGE